jgi:hypothetical protein
MTAARTSLDASHVLYVFLGQWITAGGGLSLVSARDADHMRAIAWDGTPWT